MTPDILLTLAITAGAVLLFVWNRLRVDVVGIMIMASLILTGLLTPAEGISGFANEAMLTVAAMFILSAGLLRTGAVDRLGRGVARLAGNSEIRLIAVSLAIVVPLSAVINNTPVVVVMIPLVLGICRASNIAPSRVLMPVSFGSQMGGTLTLIGTSTNLLVAGLVLELGRDRIRLFDITPPAVVLAAVGIGYLLTVGRWLTPRREAPHDMASAYDLREYTSVLVVGGDAPVVGKSLGESQFASSYGMQVVGLERGGERRYTVGADTVLEAGDLLFVQGALADLARMEEEVHLRIRTPSKPFQPDVAQGAGKAGPDVPRLAEFMVPPRSHLVGRSLRQLDFRQRFGVPVLGIQRHGTSLREQLHDVALDAGDLLLVRGTPRVLRRIHDGPDLALLGTVDLPARRSAKLKVAVGIVAGVVLLAALNVMPILLSAMLGVVAMFLTGCVTPEEAYEEVDWMVLVLLGSIIPLGLAMQETGAASLLAHSMVSVTEPLGLHGTLAAVLLLTTLLTSVISNNAAAVVLVPVVIATAQDLGASPMPYVVAVMIAASNSFMTPIGYQTNTFILGPGGYRFSDFLRVGGPLTLLMVLAGTFVIPWFFPFRP
ncbi:MAG: SLC13 family permease [Longimicrobiales bacterium]